jgi:hypothetical protein
MGVGAVRLMALNSGLNAEATSNRWKMKNVIAKARDYATYL